MWSWFSSILDVMSFSWTFCRYIRNRIEIASKCYVSSFKVDLLLYQAKFFFWNCDVYLGPDVALSDAYGGPRQTYDDDDDVNQYKDYQPETGNCTHQDLPCLVGWYDCDVYLDPDAALLDIYGGPRQTSDGDDVNQYKDYQQDSPTMLGRVVWLLCSHSVWILTCYNCTVSVDTQ